MILEETYKSKAISIVDKMPESACEYVIMMFDDSLRFKKKFKNFIYGSSEEWCERFVESYET